MLISGGASKDFTYYVDHNPGEIPHQRDFCEYIKLHRPNKRISGPDINPMTVRLFSAYAEMELIESEYAKFNCFSEVEFKYKSANITKGSQPLSTATGSAVVIPEVQINEEIELSNWNYISSSPNIFVYQNDSCKLVLFYIHRSFYNFLYHCSSVLDRVKRETDTFYSIILSQRAINRNIRHIYFLDLFENKWKYSFPNSAGDSLITSLQTLLPSNCYLRNFREYRNTITHDGFIKLQEDMVINKIYIQDGPKVPTFINQIDLLSYLNSTFSEIKNFVDKFYELMLQDAINGKI